ncbi:MAG: L-2-hydroxyglutarate oxidase [Longimicrobiales bacterium]
MSDAHRVAIIGAGIVGLATARALTQAHVESVIVLEKEPEIARHQSTHNSGVLHAGLYYAPGSLRAHLARSGIRALTEYCAAHNITHEICGKLVVATREQDLPGLHALHERGQRNGLRELRWLEPAQARDIEPHVFCRAALHVPEEGIVDYASVCRALAHEMVQAGGAIRTSAAVRRILRAARGWVLETEAGAVYADFLINCAGLHVDRIARLAGEHPTTRIVPFRGEYFRLRPERQHLVRNLIYPTPDPAFPFLGVHFTRLALGGIEAGPNAVLAFAREGYRKTDINLRELAQALSFPGLWRFLLRHPRTVSAELVRSFSKQLFVRALQRLVPEVQAADLAPGGAGVRAQALSPDGTLVQDFVWIERTHAIHVLSAPSPAATASLVIGQEIAGRALVQLRDA